MAISASTVFEVRTTGSDTACSGGFVTGASGTDYSQQNAAQYSLSGLTSSGAGNVILTSAASADMVGNLILVTAGTNFTLSTFQITSVSVGVSITVSTNNAGTAVTTGVGASGTAVIGGALASPGNAAGQLIATNFVHIKAGTYIVTTTSSNVASGIVADGKGATWIGYQTTRLDYGTQPLIQAAASGVTSVTLFSITGGGGGGTQYVANIGFDGQSKASIAGYSNTRGFSHYKLYAINTTVTGLVLTGGSFFCYATGCSGTSAIQVSNAFLIACQAYSNTTIGFLLGVGGAGGSAQFCTAYGNTGVTTDGFQSGGLVAISNCTSYGNGRAGFRITTGGVITSSVAEGNTGKGFDTNSAAEPGLFLINCAGFNNSVNVDAAFTGLKVSFITYASTAFVAAGSGNFALNNTVGGGASLRAAGFPGTMPTGLSVGFQDIGAAQHADSASGITVYPIFD